MMIDYDKIREDNISEYGNGTRHLSFLSRLYTDRTHFIFELIQNAEDAGATEIHFNLFNDRLEVVHNGRPFDELDVRGICGVDDGTKIEDLTKIGKFGVGFKSVYAFTNTPEVHSGDVSFKIENYVRPYSVPSKLENNFSKTLFIFPLGTEKISKELACKEIGNCISKLGARTLLFLRKIQEIEYSLPDLSSGVYLREEKQRESARQVCVIGEKGGIEEVENWLLFERPIKVAGSFQVVKVELGFKYDAKDKNQQNDESIERVKESPLFVFFPTERETKLGFLIQGPYTTTPGRDNVIIENDWNITLVNETALLIKDTLPKIKELGLFTASFFKTLPINPNDFSGYSMFFPIFESVRDTLQKEALLPAEDGTFITAENALLAEADWLIDLLKDDQLKLLYSTEKKWIHRKVAKGNLKTYFEKELEIETLDPMGFARKLDSHFFSKQSDQWMIDFYSQLSNNKQLWRKVENTMEWDGRRYITIDSPLRNKPFIRLQDGTHVTPFDYNEKPQVYLPTNTPLSYQPPTVKVEITNDEQARRFLSEDLKLSEFNKVYGVIEFLLPKYREQIELLPNKEEHLKDVDIIIDAIETDSQKDYELLKKELKEASFIRSKLSDSNKRYYKPGDLYFSNDSLHLYFEGYLDAQFVSSIYAKDALELFSKIGVVKKVRIKKKIPKYQGHIEISDGHGSHKRGINGFDPDIIVYGLENALSNVTLEKSRFIWNEIVIPNKECIKGTVEQCSRANFDTYVVSDEVSSSQFGKLLVNSKWLPGPNGFFYYPCELSINDLPEEFERNDKVADLLGMKKDLYTKLADEVGVPLEHIEYAKLHPEEIEKLIKKNHIDNQPTFPTRPVTNPERRLEHQFKKQSNAPDKQYEKRERNVRVTNGLIEPKTWLRNQYTNEQEQMVCQICKKEMPFKTRDGFYYFEGIAILSNKFLPKEQEAQYLALCPVCAAKYNVFVTNDDDLMSSIRDKIIKNDDCEIPILLGEEETSIRFVETHYHDLKVILQHIKE